MRLRKVTNGVQSVSYIHVVTQAKEWFEDTEL